MLERVRAAFQPVLGETGAWDRLSEQVSSETVSPGTSVRAVGESVHDVLVVEQGLFEVCAPGEPPRWATSGSMIGLAASLSSVPSPVSVTALRHSRVMRIPARALWDHGGDVRSSMAAVARLAQLPDFELVTLPPDPLVITALLDGLDDVMEDTITAYLGDAVRTMPPA